ncbi:aldehyde dehydrogenase 4 family [Salpingoeca rosetta]|uniref:Multifunctional fusion protein n=1 Tax=Salpingoeca rosetta (strain ATCC 50818 / BSB-021) TaxID=946362 RepID=F2UQG6_SALR5|nr:aldehyde dehydrogenase 4 family [Salpingoeca rosetta]EGD79871.1 aldehyde dehydrogenase 4 family [Salpingoeca rosetta]|eukprot:XP_004988492.1 aldehyde dehydrogenase 4 family [Salpingoeca rosetta]
MASTAMAAVRQTAPRAASALAASVSRRPLSHTTVLPPISNEPVREYPPESEERMELLAACARVRSETVDIPCVINGKEVFTGNTIEQRACSDHQHAVARVHLASPELIQEAIDTSLSVREEWEQLDFEHRAAVFLKAADLLSTKFRNEVLAATMIGQGKNMFQAEIDAAAEAADFYRFGVKYANEIYAEQPAHHAQHVWNRVEYRGLEGFVAGIPPFNFTAIGANLGATPAIMGNVVLWKPSENAALSNYVVFKALREAGLPDGVVNFVPAAGPTFGDKIVSSPDLAAISFTGSTRTFNTLWKGVADNLDKYKTYPRLVGECGGKNFHYVHNTADLDNAVYSTIRSAFEYQGQKCSACSRLYVPESMWPEFRDRMLDCMRDIQVGEPDDFKTFMTAVIDEKAFDKIVSYINYAKESSEMEVLAGGEADKSVGWFVQPTLVQSTNPHSKLMEEEIFGPVITAYVYPDDQWEETLDLVNKTSPYGLTGSIFSADRSVIDTGLKKLRHAAGNIYINAKSTGSVVGQQPFGGARRSGTNDKAGASSYLARFTSMQAAKECLLYLDDWKYDHMK